MATTQLNTASGGINRERTKGGPDPSTLYDLVNGYVDGSDGVRSRPGTRQEFTLPAGTVGMCAFEGEMVVFSSQVITGMPDGVRVEVLTHPRVPSTPLTAIHFAGPFLGSLFVTAEFADGEICDYWLSSADAWKAGTVYVQGAVVQPTVANGFVYRPSRLTPPGVAWAPNVERAIGDVVEPTVFNGFEYVVVEVHGTPPRSGGTEPDWPRRAGAVVVEDVDVQIPTPTVPVTPPPPTTPPRYDNPGGGGGGGSGRGPGQPIYDTVIE